MLGSTEISLFVVGLLGGVHCIGMCGGIVGALSLGQSGRLSLQLAYNAGRIFSYCAAGALAGWVGEGVAVAAQWPGRLLLFVVANLMLIAMGAYLLGAVRPLALLEALGGRFWRRLQPLTRRYLPVRNWRQALPLGALWGWLPCGLVYSALTTAMASGSPAKGTLTMLAFGLGTLPNLLLAGVLLTTMQAVVRQRWLRGLAGVLVLAFGLYGLWGCWQLAQSL